MQRTGIVKGHYLINEDPDRSWKYLLIPAPGLSIKALKEVVGTKPSRRKECRKECKNCLTLCRLSAFTAASLRLAPSQGARLFKNAGHLAVRFPVDWDIRADEAELSYDGNIITVIPIRRGPTLTELHQEFAGDPIDDDWGDDPVDFPAKPVAL